MVGSYFCEESDYQAETIEELRKLGCKCPNPIYFPDEKEKRRERKTDRRKN